MATTAAAAAGAAGNVAPELPPPDLAAARALLRSFTEEDPRREQPPRVVIAGLTDYAAVYSPHGGYGGYNAFGGYGGFALVRLTDTLFTMTVQHHFVWLVPRNAADTQPTNPAMRTDICFGPAGSEVADGSQPCVLLPHAVPGRPGVYRFEDITRGGYLAMLRLAQGPYQRQGDPAARGGALGTAVGINGRRRGVGPPVVAAAGYHLPFGVWVLVRPGEPIPTNATLEFPVNVSYDDPTADLLVVYDRTALGNVNRQLPVLHDWGRLLAAVVEARAATAREAAADAAAAAATAAAAERERAAQQARAAREPAAGAAAAAAARVVTPSELATGHAALTDTLMQLSAASSVLNRLSLLHAAAAEADALAATTAPFATLPVRLAAAQLAHKQWREAHAVALAAAARSGDGSTSATAAALARDERAAHAADGALADACGALLQLLGLRAAGTASHPQPVEWPALCKLLRVATIDGAAQPMHAGVRGRFVSRDESAAVALTDNARRVADWLQRPAFKAAAATVADFPARRGAATFAEVGDALAVLDDTRFRLLTRRVEGSAAAAARDLAGLRSLAPAQWTMLAQQHAEAAAQLAAVRGAVSLSETAAATIQRLPQLRTAAADARKQHRRAVNEVEDVRDEGGTPSSEMLARLAQLDGRRLAAQAAVDDAVAQLRVLAAEGAPEAVAEMAAAAAASPNAGGGPASPGAPAAPPTEFARVWRQLEAAGLALPSRSRADFDGLAPLPGATPGGRYPVLVGALRGSTRRVV
jgi:hypothetical protein